MQFLDQNILIFFINQRIEWLTFIMLVITYAGSYIIITGVTLLSTISFYIHKHTNLIWPFLITVGGSALTTFFLKHIFSRARPLGAFYLESSFSFPSGHATSAVALYGFLFYFIWSHDKHHLKNPFLMFLASLIILIGFSRLYLGVHYFSDVLAGYFVGLIWLFISVYFSNHFSKSKNF